MSPAALCLRSAAASGPVPSRAWSLPALLLIGVAASAAPAEAQMLVYESARPVVTVAPYVANYTPAGNYAAVTAFSPPLATFATAPVAVSTAFAPAAVPVTSFYAPVTAYAPVTDGYATTTYYAPAAVAAPVTSFYAPAAVAVPMRRGVFGGYRPVRAAWYLPAYSY